MKSFSRLYVIIILLIIVASALSRAASAQSVCEGLTTKLEALNSWNVEEEPEFYTLPETTCEINSRSYMCDWLRPQPTGNNHFDS